MSPLTRLCILFILVETTKAFIVHYDVAIGVNTCIEKTIKPISSKASSFLELISNGLFVDKSLFIDDILREAYGYSEIIHPNKWGKSTNLDMLKTFLTIQVHPNGSRILPISSTLNYQLFTEGEYRSEKFNIKLEKPLLISNQKHKRLINEYLGQVPVIHISFADIIWNPSQNYTASCDQMISKAYSEHKYLLEVYDNVIQDSQKTKIDKDQAERNKKEFLAYFQGTSEPTTLQKRLEFLANRLRDNFGKLAYLIIDDYEPIPGLNDPEFESLRFLMPHLKDRIFEQIVIAHTQPKTQVEDRFSDALFIKPYFPCFGFLPKEMDLIYHYYQIPREEQEKINHWYCGYQILDEETCNPWSVGNYLSSRQLQPYWVDTNIHHIYLNTICETPQFQFPFARLISRHRYETLHPQLTAGNARPFDVSETKHALLFLYHASYVTRKFLRVIDYSTLEGNIYQCFYRITNHEMAIKLRIIFLSKMNKVFGPQQFHLLTETSILWEQFLNGNETRSSELANRIEQYYKSLAKSPNDPQPKDDLFHAIVMLTVILKDYHFVSWPINETSMKRLQYHMIVLSSKSRGFIIDIKDGKNVEMFANQTSHYIDEIGNCPQLHDWKHINIVLLHIIPNGTVQFINTLHTLN